MGIEKGQIEEAESNWDSKATAEGIRCNVCSWHIPYSERDVYFRIGMCGYCVHQSEKDG